MKAKTKIAQRPTTSLVIVVLLLVGAIVYGGVKTNWFTVRTYKSASGGYQITFPFNMALHVNKVKVQGKNEYHSVENVIELDASGKPLPYMLISFSDNMEPQSVQEYVKNTSECDAIDDKAGQKIKIDGQDALLFKNIKCNSDGETRIYIVRGVRGYSVTFNEKEVDQKYLDLVLQNLKFD